MRIDLAGQVRAIKLANTNALLPLFEAVVNSVQSIHERGVQGGQVEIRIVRSYQLPSGSESDPAALPDIDGFEIIDNGVGFTDRHFNSFDTSFSTLKANLGGKGVGRLVWLKAFDSAAIDSTYEDRGKWYRRQFKFVRSEHGTEGMTVTQLEESPVEPSTTVRLQDFFAQYRDHAPKRADTIALRIVEHCLVMYMLEVMPRVVIVDSAAAATIDLTDVFHNEVKSQSDARDYEVRGHKFRIVDVLLRASADAENAIHFCANDREVQSKRLSGAIAHAESLLKDDGVELRYAACITGAVLDQSLNNERTGFVLSHAEQLQLGESALTWEEVEQAAIDQAAFFLRPRLQEAKQRAFARVETFVTEKEERYRILLSHRRAELERLPGNLSDERLELELHKILSDWRHTAKKTAESKLAEMPDDATSFASFQATFRKALGDLSEVVKADLADYVLHRKTVLEFFAKVLGLLDTGEAAKEEVLHGLFFPVRSESDKVSYDEHNLWLLDERLAFHVYVASDLPLKSNRLQGATARSAKRPDILIFDRRFSFSEQADTPYQSIAIVEFKRPERRDYEASDDPVQQVLGYVRELRSGSAKHPDGSSIGMLPDSTRFICHVVASLTPKLRELLESRNFTMSPDGDAFFQYNQNLNVMIEVSDYRKVLSDARKRNMAFFAKLGLPRSGRQLI